jgi:hypothetical protein
LMVFLPARKNRWPQSASISFRKVDHRHSYPTVETYTALNMLFAVCFVVLRVTLVEKGCGYGEKDHCYDPSHCDRA